MRCGAPSEWIPGSVTISTRFAPKPAISKPTSSEAPAPNFKGGAPQVKIVSSVSSTSGTVMYFASAGKVRRRASRVRALRRQTQLVDLLGVVPEHHRGVGVLLDAPKLLHRCIELLEVVDDGRGRGGRGVGLPPVEPLGGAEHP